MNEIIFTDLICQRRKKHKKTQEPAEIKRIIPAPRFLPITETATINPLHFNKWN